MNVKPLAYALAHAILQDQVDYRIQKEDAARAAALQPVVEGLPEHATQRAPEQED
jgi:hypothetical protein